MQNCFTRAAQNASQAPNVNHSAQTRRASKEFASDSGRHFKAINGTQTFRNKPFNIARSMEMRLIYLPNGKHYAESPIQQLIADPHPV